MAPGFILLLLLAATRGIDYESAHVLTVCDASLFFYATDPASLADCPGLPTPTPGRFLAADASNVSLYRTDRCSNSPVMRQDRVSLIERTIQFIKRLIDGARDSLFTVIQTFAREIFQVDQKWSRLYQQWNQKWFAILTLTLFVILNVKRKDIAVNLILSVISTSTLYTFWLMSSNLWSWCIAIGLFSLVLSRRIYEACRLRGLGLATVFHLAVPASSSLARLAADLSIVHGPLTSCIANGLSVMGHVTCLIGLYVDEKLIVVKVLLLPLYKTLEALFDSNEAHRGFIDAIYRSLDELTRDVTGERASTEGAADLDAALGDRLRAMCLSATSRWYERCPIYFSGPCVAAVNRSVIGQADRAMDSAGKWLTDLLVGGPALPVQRSAAVMLCRKMAAAACDNRTIDTGSYCSPGDALFYGRAYRAFVNATENLRRLIFFRNRFELSRDFAGLTSFDQTVTFDWLSWLRALFGALIALLFFLYVSRAFVKSFVFLYRYRNDLNFRNNKQSIGFFLKLTRLHLLLKVISFYLLEKGFEWLHIKLQYVDFSVPEEGKARLIFDVQGDGTLAKILKALLGNLSLQSRYCSTADSSVCRSPFFGTSWAVWTFLFGLSGLHFLLARCEDKSDYLLCKLSDRFVKEPATKTSRTETESEDLRKRKLMIEFLSTEAAGVAHLSLNRQLVRFYVTSSKMWYCSKLTPAFVRLIFAYKIFGISCLSCQVCYQEEVAFCFDCESLLFCRTCALFLKECPCRRVTYCRVKELHAIGFREAWQRC